VLTLGRESALRASVNATTKQTRDDAMTREKSLPMKFNVAGSACIAGIFVQHAFDAATPWPSLRRAGLPETASRGL
jgi:hypothetical protein